VLKETWLEAVRALGARHLVVGGKSLGGRIASMIADEAGVDGLVCFGYPFHPPGAPERRRTAHLEALATPALILQGTRDSFGTPDDVKGYALSRSIRVVWVPDGDHSFKPRAKSGRTETENLAFAFETAADFVRSLVP
jgi:predicted alpha/beta-hydrolase family hydrolase